MGKDSAESAELKDALGLKDEAPPPAEPVKKTPVPEDKKEPSAPVKKEKPAPVTPKKEEHQEELELPGELFDIPPAKKEEQAPAEKKTPAAEDEIDSLKLSDRQHRAFVSMREELKAAKQEYEKIKAAIPAPAVEIKENPEHLKTIEALETQLTEAYDKLGQLSLDADPRFHARFSHPQQVIVEEIKGILKDFEHDETLVERLVPLSRKQRLDLLKEEAPESVSALTPLFMQLDQIQRERNDALKNHKAMRQAIDNEQKQNTSILTQQAKGALFKQALEHVMGDGTFILKPVEGNNAWNSGVAKVQERVKYLFTADDPNEQTKALILGAAAPIYLEMLKKEHSRRVELEKQLKLRQGNRPSLDSRQTQNREPQKRVEELSPDEAAERAAEG